MQPTSFFVLLVSTVTAVCGSQNLDLIYVMTKGGPANSTSLAIFYIYQQALLLNEYGYAAAMASVLVVVLMAITVLHVHADEGRTFHLWLRRRRPRGKSRKQARASGARVQPVRLALYLAASLLSLHDGRAAPLHAVDVAEELRATCSGRTSCRPIPRSPISSMSSPRSIFSAISGTCFFVSAVVTVVALSSPLDGGLRAGAASGFRGGT